MICEIREARHEDILVIAHNMRTCDINEVWASHNVTPIEALQESYSCSDICHTAVIDGIPISMFGVVKGADEEQGFVWMLGTDGMEINKAWVMKQSVLMVKEFLKKYKYLINFIDARNKRSISWIKRCGAEVFDAQPFGAEGLPFHYFIISREE